MDITIYPTKLQGKVTAIPSKSQAHRLLICAAFADRPTTLLCPQTNQDIEATAGCLRSLGAQIQRTDTGYLVYPVRSIPAKATLDCRESGSTLRFLLPVTGALGVDATFQLAGRLPSRPLSPLWEEMERMGCCLSRPTNDTVRCNGRLKPGLFAIDGGVSSQFITGLYFAAALMERDCSVHITGTVESKPYIDMTVQALSLFGVEINDDTIHGRYPLLSPGSLSVEGDWSNAAFFLTAKYMGSQVEVGGLNSNSPQGDRAIADLLPGLSGNPTVSAGDIPDLVPILAVAAGASNGAVFTQVSRLRLKESDRVATVAAMLNALGANTEVTENSLTVFPGKYRSCTVDAAGDHRIAMAAAIAATAASGPVTILGAECVAKSYPSFWDEYRQLGGHYEQYIR